MIILHIVLSVISVLAGFAAFLTFLILNNNQAAVWGFVTGLCAVILFKIHLLKYLNKISEYYSVQSIWKIAWLGIYTFAFGFSAFVYNLIILIVEHAPILPVEHSTVIPLIWCILTFKTGVLLFWFGRKYALEVENDRSVLIQTEENNPQ